MSDILIYQTEDGRTQVNLLVQEHTVWLNQSQLAKLFDTSVQNIGLHIKSILEDNELDGNSVIKGFFITAADGKQYQVKHYGRQRHTQPQTNGSVCRRTIRAVQAKPFGTHGAAGGSGRYYRIGSVETII